MKLPEILNLEIRTGNLILPRVLAVAFVSLVGVLFLVSALIMALSELWEFIDSHPTWTGFSMLFIIAVIGFGWGVRYIRRK